MAESIERILKYYIYDLQKNKVAESGQLLSQNFLQTLIKRRPPLHPPKSLWNYPEIMDDLRDACSLHPYDKIFDTEERCQNMCNMITRAHMYSPVFDTLQYFKRHDEYTYRHSLRVAALATWMANDFSSVYRLAVKAASVVPSHDFGKVNVPLDLLIKTEALTPSEISLMQEHTVAGFVLITYYIGEEDPFSCQIAYEHHELMDGSGYPRSIKQTEQLVELVTICDMFDALVSPRPYRKEQYTVRAAIELLCDSADAGKINGNGVKLLISYNRADKPPLENVVVSKERRGKEPERNNYSLGLRKKE